MSTVEQALSDWKSSLCKSVELASMISRSPIAHKWKAPFRSLILRESVAWRAQDLLEQSLQLHEATHTLGARILLRSAFETVAVLIYLNQITRRVLAGTLNFHEFSNKSSTLLLGSRDKSTSHKALNITTIFQKCNARYPGIENLYAVLSESAHPNYEGTCVGYSCTDKPNYVTNFSNKWAAMYGKHHVSSIALCIRVFQDEYNDEWQDAFEKLEHWITTNDAVLEATKSAST
ncbi:MAG: hypothetical protein ACOH2B_02540 [Burkholderiaceae bacterium]